MDMWDWKFVLGFSFVPYAGVAGVWRQITRRVYFNPAYWNILMRRYFFVYETSNAILKSLFCTYGERQWLALV